MVTIGRSSVWLDLTFLRLDRCGVLGQKAIRLVLQYPLGRYHRRHVRKDRRVLFSGVAT